MNDRFEERLVAQAAGCDSVVGLFGPHTTTWRVYRERALILGGPRALLLQLAHPAVAQGVFDHSHFRHDAMGRGQRTFEVVNRIAFGATDEALAAARRMRQRHSVVRGRIAESGEPYDARDPALLLWVAATLIDSAIWTYDHLVEALSDEQREQFYAEQRRWFWVHGIEPEQAPATFSDFRAYMNQMLHGSVLRVTSAASAVLEALLEQEPSVFVASVLSMQPSAVLKVLDRAPLRHGSLKVLVTWAGALMPARLREAFGLPWGLRERAIWSASVRGVRWVVPTLPSSSRYNPIYLAAVARMRAHGRAVEV